jgi:hypothetical protein
VDAGRPQLRLHTLPRCPVEHLVRLEQALLDQAEPALLVAELQGSAILLGRHQRAASALERGRVALAREPVLRRLSGGRALHAGDGLVAVALALPSAGALLPAPIAADKLLNRHVRGLLQALRRVTSLPVNYFGRDYLAAPGGAVAVVGQEGTAGGAVLLEAIVSLSAAHDLPAELRGYPVHSDARADGPRAVPLTTLAPGADFAALASAVAEGYGAAYGADLVEAPPPAPAQAPGPDAAEDEAGLEESGVADVPIGFVEALCRHDGAVLTEARLRGDFIAPSFVIRALEASLPGTPLEFEALGRKVDAALRAPHACLLGVRHVRVFPDALLAAAGRS